MESIKYKEFTEKKNNCHPRKNEVSEVFMMAKKSTKTQFKMHIDILVRMVRTAN